MDKPIKCKISSFFKYDFTLRDFMLIMSPDVISVKWYCDTFRKVHQRTFLLMTFYLALLGLNIFSFVTNSKTPNKVMALILVVLMACYSLFYTFKFCLNLKAYLMSKREWKCLSQILNDMGFLHNFSSKELGEKLKELPHDFNIAMHVTDLVNSGQEFIWLRKFRIFNREIFYLYKDEECKNIMMCLVPSQSESSVFCNSDDPFIAVQQTKIIFGLRSLLDEPDNILKSSMTYDLIEG